MVGVWRLSEAARALAASPSGLLLHPRRKEWLQVQERPLKAQAQLELEQALLPLLAPLFCRMRPL